MSNDSNHINRELILLIISELIGLVRVVRIVPDEFLYELFVPVLKTFGFSHHFRKSVRKYDRHRPRFHKVIKALAAASSSQISPEG